MILWLLQGQRASTDPSAMMAAAAESLGRHLAADRVGFFEMADDDTLRFGEGWTNGVLEPLSGTMPASWLGTAYLAAVRAGRTLGISDYTVEPLTADARFGELGTRALIGAPIIRSGRWHAGLYVNHAGVREWTPEEIQLVRDVADLTWDAVERARAEGALRASEAQFRALVQNIHDYAIYMVDPEGHITEWTEGAERVKGYAAEEVLGHHISMFYTPDDVAAGVPGQVLAQAAASGRAERESWRIRKGGERFWANEIVTVVRDPAGELVGFAKISRDLTERRQADAALREREERFRTLIQRSADAIQLVAEDGTILYSSDSVEAVLGYRPEEIDGRSIVPYVHPDDLGGVGVWLSEVAAVPGRSGTRQYRVLHKDGSWVWVETTITNHLDTPTIHAIVGNFRNITERKQIEAAREAFADAAAHDLKTPVATMKAQAQLLLRRVRRGQIGEPGSLEAGLTAIDVAAGRMARLIDEMMDAAHLRSGRSVHLSLSFVDLVALAAVTAAEAQRGTTMHRVRVEPSVPDLTGMVDRDRLARVFANLLDNAVKYSPEGGEVVVRLGREESDAGGYAVISVSDEGMGIPAGDVARIFDRFHRGANVGRITGTGIGLAGVKQIVEFHGGSVTAASEEGVGTTVTLRLPLTGEAAAHGSP